MEKARQTLDRALQALGGLDRLRALNSLYFKGKGHEFRSADLQGPDPSTPTRTFHEETTAAFPSQERILLIRNKLEPEQIYGFHDRGFATMQQVRQILNFRRPS